MASIEIDSKSLKSPAGVAAALLVVLVALGYMHWRRSLLISQGTEEARLYLTRELPAAYSRKLLAEDPQAVDPARLQALGDVEIVEFSPSYFFRPDRDDRVRVHVVARAAGDEFAYDFRFKSVLGSWKLDAEVAPPLFGPN